MPENETLTPNARNASRWQGVNTRMDGGQTPVEAFPEIQNQFYAALQKVWKQWRARGVEAQSLFDAALEGPEALDALLRQTRFDSYARLIRDCSCGLSAADRESLIRQFLNSAWENARGELQLDRRNEAMGEDFNSQINDMLERMVRSLVNNPNRFPSRPPRREPPTNLDDLLGESLL
jgi:hypothetical protein